MSQIGIVNPEIRTIAGTCESAWRPDLPCPNAAEFLLVNSENRGFAIMCGPHKDGFLAEYGGQGVAVEPYTLERAEALLAELQEKGP